MRIDRQVTVPPLVPRLARALTPLAAFVAAAGLVCVDASAQRRERSGQEVVEATCASCHAKGENNAPRIGDEKAWAPRAAQGLSALTEHALKGVRAMPAHGGNPNVSDIEVERAIIHMVNLSGGRWVVPLGGATPAMLRSSEQVVQTACANCHKEGLNGAPKIGDRAAWIPRVKKGLDTLVKSAVHGHGAMPARGGVADLSDMELQGAIVYMFNQGVALPPPAPVPAAAAGSADPFHKVVGGIDVYLGVIKADAIPAAQRPTKAPSGRSVYHVNISLYDAKTQAPITDAQVKVKVADPMGGETRALDIVAINNTISYGGYFRMPNKNPYTVTAQIQLPGGGAAAEARFDYRAR